MVSSSEITTLVFATGASLDVEASLEQVAKQLENAARSSAGTVAWFDEAAAREPLGVNPAHVVSIRRKRD